MIIYLTWYFHSLQDFICLFISHGTFTLAVTYLFTSHDHMVHPLLRVTYDYLSHKVLSLFAVTLYVHISHMVLSLFAVTYNYLLHMVFPLIFPLTLYYIC